MSGERGQDVAGICGRAAAGRRIEQPGGSCGRVAAGRRIGQPVRAVVVAGLCLALAACGAPEFHIAPPVPQPVHSYVAAAGQAEVWAASTQALAELGMKAGAGTDEERGILASAFADRQGNSRRERTAGVAHYAVERDLYSSGRDRLIVEFTALGAGQTRVTVACEIWAELAKRGEVRYTIEFEDAVDLPVAPQAPASGDKWERLTSNGVHEDQFLAALVAALAHHD